MLSLCMNCLVCLSWTCANAEGRRREIHPSLQKKDLLCFSVQINVFRQSNIGKLTPC
ncbi:hypothetical protein AMTRI_Chr06g199430 [Amborella trichopoda]